MVDDREKEHPRIIGVSREGVSGTVQYGGQIVEVEGRVKTGREAALLVEEMLAFYGAITGCQWLLESLVLHVDSEIKPASDRPESQRCAFFGESLMDDMETPLRDVKMRMLLAFFFGWSVQEIVTRPRRKEWGSKYDDGMIGVRAIEPRAQASLDHWQFDEATGKAVSMVQRIHGSPLMGKWGRASVPLGKAIHFVMRDYKGSPEGWRHTMSAEYDWEYVKNLQAIEAIGIEKDYTGLLHLMVPRSVLRGKTADDRKELELVKDIGRKARNNELAFILTAGEEDAWGKTGYGAKLLSSPGTRPVDANAVISRYEKRSQVTCLANVLEVGQTKLGSYKLSDNLIDILAYAGLAILDMMHGCLQDQLFNRLFSWNRFHPEDYAKFYHGRIDEIRLAEVADFAQKMIPIGALDSGPAFRRWSRQILRAPLETEQPEAKAQEALDNSEPFNQNRDQPPGEAPEEDPPQPEDAESQAKTED